MPEEVPPTGDPKKTQSDAAKIESASKQASPKVKSAAYYKRIGLDPKVYGAK